MTRTRQHIFPLLSAAALFALLLWLLFWRVVPETTFFANDQALTFAVLREMGQGYAVWQGPPSHVGGRHLGPFYYWFLYGAYWLGGGDELATFMAYTCLMLLSSVVVFALLRSLLTEQLRPWAYCGALLVLCAGYIDTLRIIWHPHVLLPLSAIFYLASIAVLRGGWSALPAWLMCGSILVQTHLASAPMVVGTALVLGIHWLTHRRAWLKSSSVLRPWLWGLGLVGLSLLPLLVYETNYESNLLKLFSVHAAPEVASEVRTPAGLRAMLRSLAAFFEQYSFGLAYFVDWQDHIALLKSALRCSVIIMLALALWRIWRRYAWELLLFLGGVAATAVALMRFPAPLYEYYWSALLPLPILATAALLAFGLQLLRLGVAWQRVVAGSFLLLLLLHSAVSIATTTRRFSRTAFIPYHTLSTAVAVASTIRADSAANPIELLARYNAKVLRNAVLYFLGREYLPSMEAAWKFRELPETQVRALNAEPPEDSALSNTGYLLVCPRPYYRATQVLLKEISATWSFKKELDLTSCETCKQCYLAKLERGADYSLAAKDLSEPTVSRGASAKPDPRKRRQRNRAKSRNI